MSRNCKKSTWKLCLDSGGWLSGRKSVEGVNASKQAAKLHIVKCNEELCEEKLRRIFFHLSGSLCSSIDDEGEKRKTFVIFISMQEISLGIVRLFKREWAWLSWKYPLKYPSLSSHYHVLNLTLLSQYSFGKSEKYLAFAHLHRSLIN